MKAWWRRMRPYVLSWLAFNVANLLGKTIRIKTVGLDRVLALKEGKICAGWHGRTFLATQVFRDMGFWTLISHSRDGEMQKNIFTKFGFRTIRGSTGRGGMKAAIEMIRVLRKGDTIAYTPDGPRGPSGIVQKGLLVLAQKSGAALIPVGVSAKNRWLVRSWDKWMVPKPFTEGIMIFGLPMYVKKDASEAEVEQIRIALEKEMHRLEELSEAEFGYPRPNWHSAEAEGPNGS